MKKIMTLLIISFFSILLITCNTDNLNSITEIHIDASKKNVYTDEIVHLVALADNGDDITSETIFYVNDNPIESNVFTASTSGIYIVQGEYKDIKSNKIEIKVTVSTGYSQKVLVEDYTGVWCGYCPRVAYAIQQIKANDEFGNKMIPVAIHLYSSNDPYNCEDGTALKDAFSISGLPQGRINKTIVWQLPQEENLNAVTDLIGGDSLLGIAINSSLSSGNVDVTIRVGFAQDFTNLGIVVYLLEDELVHNQTNYTSFFGGNDIIENFEHNDVLRKVYTNILGDAIPDNQSVTNNIYEFTINAPLPDNIENSNNLKLVAFVVNKTTNKAINVQEVHLGGNQPFD